MDIAQFPCNEYTNEQQNGKTNPHCQSPGHICRFVSAFPLAAFHHEKESGTQTAQNGYKACNDKVFHEKDYGVNRRFWLITLKAVLSGSLTVSLGLWQLSRALEKQAMQLAMDNNAHLPGMTESVLTSLPEPMKAIYRPVEVRGRWEAERTVFLENRPMGTKVGFYVVTPLRLEGSAAVVLVQRGWVQRNFVDREAVPAIPTPSGVVQIRGRIAPPPAKLYELGRPGTGVIRQNLDIGEFMLESGLSLMPVSIQQMGEASDGLVRDWPQVSAGVEKHHGYAFQWFGLSALITVLYVWFQIVRKFFPRRFQHGSAERHE